MALSLVAHTTATSSTSTLNMTLPTNIAGDLLLVSVTCEQGNMGIATPSGWTAISYGYTPSSTSSEVQSFYKISAGAEASVTLTLSISKRNAGVALSIRGADTTTPIDAFSFTNSGSSLVTTISAPSITTSLDGSYIVDLFFATNSFGTMTPPASETFIASAASLGTLYVMGGLQTTAGATGTRTASWTNSRRAGGALIGIRPLVSSTGKIKAYVSSSFVAKPVKVWNGSAWVVKPVKRWNGSAWVLTNY